MIIAGIQERYPGCCHIWRINIKQLDGKRNGCSRQLVVCCVCISTYTTVWKYETVGVLTPSNLTCVTCMQRNWHPIGQQLFSREGKELIRVSAIFCLWWERSRGARAKFFDIVHRAPRKIPRRSSPVACNIDQLKNTPFDLAFFPCFILPSVHFYVTDHLPT